MGRAAEYFRRWTAKWPTVQALAAASLEEVNEMWAGLGYYRRAKYLLDGARYVEEQLGGTFPSTSKELQQIPGALCSAIIAMGIDEWKRHAPCYPADVACPYAGVGAYTGNAIASIACEEPVAVVDGNVVRVLSRLRKLAGDPTSKENKAMHVALADALLDPERPGDFNQVRSVA